MPLQVRQLLVAVLASTASAFVVSPRPTAPTLSATEVRTATPQMFLGWAARTAADTVAFGLGFKNKVKGTGPFYDFELSREGEAKAGGEVVSTAVFALGMAALLTAANNADMASRGL
jgi:hypothetical protein